MDETLQSNREVKNKLHTIVSGAEPQKTPRKKLKLFFRKIYADAAHIPNSPPRSAAAMRCIDKKDYCLTVRLVIFPGRWI